MDNFDLKKYLAEGKLLKEETKTVSFYASYPLQPTLKEGNEWKDEFKSGVVSSFGKGANGKVEGKPAILCSNHPFDMVDDDTMEEIPSMVIKFKKPLSEVYIDKDDYDLDEFGIEDEEAWDFVERESKPSLEDLLQFGIKYDNEDYSFYGCYVENISSGEILNISPLN